MWSLDIRPDVLERMTSLAEAAFPNECCGLFHGAEEEGKQATTAVDNRKEGGQRRRFEVSGLVNLRGGILGWQEHIDPSLVRC